MNTFENITEYIADQPEKHAKVLENLRQLIKKTAPAAEETISYGMPAYRYNGILVYFAAFKNHYSLFPGSGSVLSKFAEELSDYKTSKGTVQFDYDKPLPTALVKRIVAERMKENEMKVTKKKSGSQKT